MYFIFLHIEHSTYHATMHKHNELKEGYVCNMWYVYTRITTMMRVFMNELYSSLHRAQYPVKIRC